MKDIKEDIISTTNKEEFFLFEMKFFHKRSMKAFKKMMDGLEDTCHNCGVFYWKGCEKRCQCNG